MIVTAHQPNFLPGISVVNKVAESDAVIWLDEVQYTKGGYINRNRLGIYWLTVPVERNTDGCPINRVRLAYQPWRVKMIKTLNTHFEEGEFLTELRDELARPYRLLVGLNVSLLNLCFSELGIATQFHFQSHLDGGHAVLAVSEDSAAIAPISARLAMMVEEVGGTEYLSGPSGRNYLDERPFEERGISVRYFEHDGPNPSVVTRCAQLKRP